MITNEHRAHDLAIASMNYVLSNPQSSTLGLKKDDNGNTCLDLFTVYLELYKSSLIAINREFSEQ